MNFNDLYTSPASEITFDLLRDFVLAAEESNLLTETLTLELKERRSGDNIALAVAALANTDGGVVLVGVSEDQTGIDRLVGVSQPQRDSIITHLGSVLPNDLPEEVVVRIPGSEKLIMILRVDADTALRPVTVAGKVVFRLPGQKAPADRQRIINLVEESRSGNNPRSIETYTPQMHAREMPLWPEPQNRAFVTSRIVGGITLPNRILDRPWLSTAAKDALSGALENSPIPDMIWNRNPIWRESSWRTTSATATTVNISCEPSTLSNDSTSTVPIGASAYLSLSDRTLSLLLAVRVYQAKSFTVRPLNLEHLYYAVLAGLVTITSVCERVAVALDAHEPSSLTKFEGWIQHNADYVLTSVIDCEPYTRDSNHHPRGGWFPPAQPKSTSINDLDSLARGWTTVLLLDLGLRGFEYDLEQIPRPTWAE